MKMMRKKLKLNKEELNLAVRSFGCTDYDKNAGTVRGGSELAHHAPSEDQLANMEKLIRDNGREDDILILSKCK
tara:strand:+ start:224 stop:445 length:222 start_codon:yes stop_codon:yes gene_type:complete